MIWIIVSTGAIYFLLISCLFFGWKNLCSFDLSETKPTTYVSVIIPMRNEEDNIKSLLRTLCTQKYPANQFEIIVVDDHSSDQSLMKAKSQQNDLIRILELPEGITGKKQALALGIEQSKGDLIVTSDADCSVGENWVATHAAYFEKFQPIMLLGPVCGKYNTNFSKIQALEMFSLLGSSAGAAALNHAIMCNGANLSFSRKIYPNIQQIYKNNRIRSGDDMFVLQQIKKTYPKQILYIKSLDGRVRTNLSYNLQSFLQQRRRWAGKAVFYNDPDILLSGAIVLWVNILLLISLIFAIISSHFHYFIFLFLSKSFIDFVFLFSITSYFGEKRLMRWFPLVQSFYFLYVCLTVFSSIAFTNQWKERPVKH